MTIRIPRTRLCATALAGAATGLLVLTACGSGGSTTSSPGTSTPSTSTTVTVRDDGGTKLLATQSGETLYTSDQENGRPLCTSTECHAVWIPLTVGAAQHPTAPGGVADHLSTLKLQDGAMQVTYDAHPLYTFALDHGAGQINGNGKADSFGGTDFTWHAVTVGGTSPTQSPSEGGGGYGY